MSSPLSTYVNKATSRQNPLSEVMEQQKNKKLQELEELEIDSMIAKKKKEMKDASPLQSDSSTATNLATTLFAGRSPLEIKQILSNLTEDEIQKINLIAASNQNNFSNLRGLMQPSSGNSTKDIIEIVKLVSELQQPKTQGGNDMAGMAKAITEAMKLGVDMAKSQQPQSQQQDPMSVYKMVQEIVRPFQESASMHQRELIELKLKEAESKNVDPVSYIKNLKSLTAELGIGGNSDRNEYDLKLEEMKQNKDLETKKLDWEMKKWELDKEKEGGTLDTVKEILAGPAGEILKSFGNAGAERLRSGTGNKNPNGNGQSQQSQLVKVKCPNCAGDFSANPQLAMIQCPLCGVQLQNGNSPPPETSSTIETPVTSASEDEKIGSQQNIEQQNIEAEKTVK